jgi:quercetin dioxygenase-like cupin family protein
VSIIHRPINWEDERGVIRDIFPTGSPESVTLITNARGAVRGNHYHRISSQYAFVVSGRMLAFTRSESDLGDVTRHEMSPGDMILHRPGESHAYLALENTIFIVFAEGVRKGVDYERDTHRVEPLFDPIAELSRAEG